MTDLGMVDAYAFAVSKGYTGTREEYAELMASYASVGQAAAASATAAAGSATTANNAKTAAQSAQTAAEAAQTAATSAKTAAQSAATTATDKAGEAATSATAAAGSATAAISAKTAAQTAQTGAESAAGTATNKADAASTSATNAATSEDNAEAWAVGKINGTDVPSSATQYHNNSKYYAEQAAASAASLVIDPTLTQSGQAADAKATGDEISAVKDDLTNLQNTMVTDTASGSIASFTDGADGVPMESLIVNVEPNQPNDYDSVWPAGGGKNLLENTGTTQTINDVTFTVNDDGTVTANGTADGTTQFIIHDYQALSEYGIVANTEYMFSGGYGTTNAYMMLSVNGSGTEPRDTSGSGVSFTPTDTTLSYRVIIIIASGTALNNVVFKPMICLSSASNPTTFTPYENICPISGWTQVQTTVADDTENPTTTHTYTTALGQTVYGGTLDVVSGVLTVTHGYIASYNGETLPSTWISDRDVYAEGTTPTTGAEVVYALATPTTVQLTAQEVDSLLGDNNVFADAGSVEVTYTADLKKYIAKVVASL